jgi:hypothetical protein
LVALGLAGEDTSPVMAAGGAPVMVRRRTSAGRDLID